MKRHSESTKELPTEELVNGVVDEQSEDDNQQVSDFESDFELIDDESVDSSENQLGQSGFDSDSFDSEESFEFESGTSGDELTPQEKYLAATDSEDDDFAPQNPINTIGNVPLEWYDDYPHIGYDLDGKKVMKPATKDELDKFLSKMDDPTHWSTFEDKTTHEKVTLTQEELGIIQKLQGGNYPDTNIDPYEPYIDFFTQDVMVTPITGRPEPKRRFIPSKWEHKKVMQIVRAIRKGLIIPGKPKSSNNAKSNSQLYDIWDNQDEEKKPRVPHIPAPKLKLPETYESINPPLEYLPTPAEEEEWLKLDPEDRQRNFLPKSYSNLRSVPGYTKFIQERFGRCLDLYLCPRKVQQKILDPESLLPKLPNLKDLEPFPKNLSLVYKGHKDKVRSFSVDPTGQFMVSGSDDCEVRLWEISSTRCLRIWKMQDPIISISFNPNKNLSLFAVATGSKVIVINPLVAGDGIQESSNNLTDINSPEDTSKSAVTWIKPTKEEYESGYRIILLHKFEVSYVTWHKKGDYFASLAPDASIQAVQIHQLTKHQSQNPFSKSQPSIQRILFHPNKPFFFVATQREIKVYNLIRQSLQTTLHPSSAQWISSISIHPNGDHLICGTYDQRIHFFDMDLSNKPYRTFSKAHHGTAVREVAFHSRYPMFGTSGDDGEVHIFHASVGKTWNEDALVVPVKMLKKGKHQVLSGLGVLCCMFHPVQPWIFSSGADGDIKLYT